MFIAIVGTRCSGKSTVENYLVNHKGFQRVRLYEDTTTSSSRRSDVASTISRKSSDTLFLDEPTPNPPDNRLSFLTMISPPPSALLSPSPDRWPQRNETLWFSTPAQMLQHVTRNWRTHFVTLDLYTKDCLANFITRPFFMIVSVDAPLLVRFQRAARLASEALSLGDFVCEHDQHRYGATLTESPTSSHIPGSSPTALIDLDRLARLRILNSFESEPLLYAHLDHLNLLDPERLRPGWDAYFMQLAELASERSNCMKRRVGAILVRNKRILATGYNGTPRGLTNCNEGGCTRCNSGSETSEECLCLHAEENALLEAGRERIGDGAVLYCNTCPCLKCTIKIIQTGIREVVYNLSYKVDDASASLFNEAGVLLRRHATPT